MTAFLTVCRGSSRIILHIGEDHGGDFLRGEILIEAGDMELIGRAHMPLGRRTVSGFVIICRLAALPTMCSPSALKATTEGVVLVPSGFGMTLTLPSDCR